MPVVYRCSRCGHMLQKPSIRDVEVVTGRRAVEERVGLLRRLLKAQDGAQLLCLRSFLRGSSKPSTLPPQGWASLGPSSSA